MRKEGIYLRTLYKVGDFKVRVWFDSEKQEQQHLKFLNLCSQKIKEAIEQAKQEGIQGNEEPIKKIIYDKWGRSEFDGHGNPLKEVKESESVESLCWDWRK